MYLLPAKQHPTKALTKLIVRIIALIVDRTFFSYQAEDAKLGL